MPAVANEQNAVTADFRPAVIVKARCFSEGGQHIQLRKGGRGLLDLRQVSQHFFADALK